MRKIITAIAASALALSGAAVAAKETVSQKGEAELAKLIDGRTAGKPVNCITTMRSGNNLRTIDRTAIVYDAGNTVYVARPTDPDQLGPWDVLVVKRTSGSQLCTNDIMYTIDQGTGFRSGVVFLKDFVPYTKNAG